MAAGGAKTTTRAWSCVALLFAVSLAACSGTAALKPIKLTVPAVSPRPELPTAAEREHARILASYGGLYENAHVQSVIEKTVARLVAASERPELHYQVTILNSPAINAFALPNGHLYITRGLIALANDEAELASVL